MTEVKLSITPIEGFPDNYRVVISGSGFEHAQIRRPDGKYGAMTRCFDDRIVSPTGAGFVSADGTFHFEANAISGKLNEDWGKDEIYAIVSIGSLGSTTDYKSNTVSGYF